MTDIVLAKTASGALIPADQQAQDFLAKIKLGAGVTVSIKRHRNIGHHRKYFALMNLAFDAWEPECKKYKGEHVLKNFDQFRNDVTVLAGHYEPATTLKGDVRLTAKSISFGSMSQDDFDSLYNATINVILSRVLTSYRRDDLDEVVERLLRFD